MRGCGVRSAGGPVELLELPEPGDPGPGQLVLEIQAAGIGAWDALLHTGGWDVGLSPPAALGVEGTGIVTAAAGTSPTSLWATLFSCTRRPCPVEAASGLSGWWSMPATSPVDPPA